MKNSLKLFLGLAAVLGTINLTSCEEEIVTTDLAYGQLWDSTLENQNDHFVMNRYGTTKTSYSDLATLMNNEQSFVAVIVGEETCACWRNFRRDIFLPYIKLNNLRVYYVLGSEMDKAPLDEKGKPVTFGIQYDHSNANIVIVNKGKVAAQKFAKEGEDFHDKKLAFFEWMNDRISSFPKMLYVSNSQLDNLYTGTVDPELNTKLLQFTIYFSRSSCGDCTYLNKYYLTDYLISHEYLETSYIIDCDAYGIRFASQQNAKDGVQDDTDKTHWAQWKQTYGLASSNDNEAGYGTGFVPTLFNVQCNDEGIKTGDYILGGDVFFNDTITKQEDDTFKVTDSYFTTERLDTQALSYLAESNIATKVLKDLTIAKNTTSDTDYIYQQKTLAPLHWEITQEFLNSFIKKLSIY